MALGFVTFRADFPDDAVEDEDGEVHLGGENVTTAIAEYLRAAGYETTRPELEDEHGWFFDANKDGRSYWILVTVLPLPDESCMHCNNPFWRRWTKAGRAAHAALVDHLHTAMTSDPRFSDLLWYKDSIAGSRRDAVGAKTPVDQAR
jgi:hypothetical protein